MNSRHNSLQKKKPAHWVWGFTIIELILVLGITVIMASVLWIGLLGRKKENDLQNAAKHVASILREAQSRSVVQANNTTWSVLFVNTSTPYYALRYVDGGVMRESGHFALPKTVGYISSTIPLGGASTISFSAISGRVSSASTTAITIYLVPNPVRTVTISIASSGAVSF